MRSLFLGLAALAACLTSSFGGAAFAQQAAPAAAPAAAAAAAPAPQTPAEKGMEMAPAMITAAQISCTPIAANFLFTGEATIGETKTQADFVEVACQDNLGYVLATAKDGSGTQAFDCIATSGNGADGQPHPLKCALPANANPAKTVQPVLEARGLKCDIQNAHAVGMTAAATYYEFTCKDADGLFVGLENPRSEGKIQVNSCYQRIGANPACTLTTKEQSLAPILALASQAPKPCAATDQRYVTRSQAGNVYYEFACPDKTGFIVETKPDGSFSVAIPCAQATRVAGGCTLTQFTPAQGASGDDQSKYTDLAKKAGFNCDVSWFGRFPHRNTDPANVETVELACANQPEGGVGYFGGGMDSVVTCVQANALGFKCSHTDPALGYPKLTAALKSKGRTTCTVNQARHVGFSPEEDFVEVGCADGAPGWVIAFASRTNTVTDILNCGEADGIAGGCQLPTNIKKR
jgi:hypothetical protein